ncbi:NAD-dependent epimerase/dehydratase family protein [Nonomuraea sp. NPDC050536]|uniref:NAD-dependent epimerase/dehydratase family protein n=1 Tax=Nonomuraea sp. NPDC050536 TaxID=3364366 RepID=UPI0037CADACD
MKVLVLGATGYIGGAVVEKLQERGHDVVVVVRGERQVPGVTDVRNGDLSDPATIEVTPDIDAVVHAAQLTGDEAVDLEAIGKLTVKPLVYVSGVWVLGPVDGGHEESPTDPIPLVGYRPKVERLVRDAGGTVVRPGVVHGRGAGIAALLRGQAAERGQGVYVSDGTVPTWAFVHVDDLAELIVAVVEKGEKGALYHGITEEGVPLTEVAQAAAESAGVARSAHPWPLEEAAQLLGQGFAEALALSQRVGSDRTRAALGWNPSRPGIVADLVEGSYQGSL